VTEPTSKKANRTGQTKPDTVFKAVTGKMAQEAQLDLLNVELPRLPSTDLIIHVPQGKDLSATPFEFFAPYNIVEFKSENDPFDEFEFAKSLGRTLLFYDVFKKAKYAEILTVFVCARHPDGVIEHLKVEEIKYEPVEGKPWLITGKFEKLNFVFVLCRELPLEEKFYRWLIFANSQSTEWKKFVTMLMKEQNLAILDLIGYFRLKELAEMKTKLKSVEAVPELSPEDLEFMDKLVTSYLSNQKLREQFLSRITEEELIDNLTPEQLDKLAELIEKRKKRRKK
jgi:hypothetical protein